MKVNRIQISEDSRSKLSSLKRRTGLLPNVLCRIALALSLEELSEPVFISDATDGSEFTRFTLMGEWDPLIVDLITERAIATGNNKDNNTLIKYFRLHLNRGIVLLYGRVKNIADLEQLF